MLFSLWIQSLHAVGALRLAFMAGRHSAGDTGTGSLAFSLRPPIATGRLPAGRLQRTGQAPIHSGNLLVAVCLLLSSIASTTIAACIGSTDNLTINLFLQAPFCIAGRKKRGGVTA